MSLIFRKNASKKEKLYTLFILLLLVCSLYGLMTNFYLSKEVNINIWVVTLSGILLIIPLFFDKHPSNKLNSFRAPKKMLMYASLVFTSSIFCFVFIYMFLPAAYTDVWGESFSEQATITRKSDTYKKKGCDIRIYVDLVTGKLFVSEQFYKTVDVGDKVLVGGIKTALGYKISSLRLPSN